MLSLILEHFVDPPSVWNNAITCWPRFLPATQQEAIQSLLVDRCAQSLPLWQWCPLLDHVAKGGKTTEVMSLLIKQVQKSLYLCIWYIKDITYRNLSPCYCRKSKDLWNQFILSRDDVVGTCLPRQSLLLRSAMQSRWDGSLNISVVFLLEMFSL